MASQLRVDEIIASTGSSVAIGTAGGSVTLAGDFTVDTSKGLNVGTGASIFSPSSNVLTLGTNSAERVRIDSSGNIGIGVTNPGDYWYQAEKLVVANTSGNSGATILASTSGTSNIAFADGISGDTTRRGVVAYYHSDDSMRFNTAGDNERLRITSDGKIGFNYAGTPPSEDIMICTSGQASPAGISLSHLSGGNRYGARLQSISGANEGIVISSLFNSTYTERLRINSSGYVGIGTDNPGYKLDVRPTPSDPTSGSPPAGAFLQIRADDATVGNGPSLVLSNFGGSKETAWRISAVSTSGNNGDLVFNGYAGGATYPEAARFTSAGNLKFPSGQGIDFSATSDAGGMTSELLDDYEEGTWTPVLYCPGGNPSLTYTYQSGKYTKIGNLIYATFDLAYSAKSSNGSGTLFVTLPINAGGYSAYHIALLRSARCTALPTSVTQYDGAHAIIPNSDRFEINTNDGAGNAGTITGANLASSGRVVGSAVYQT